MNLKYTANTEENKALRRQLLKAYLGKAVHIEIDRPIGFVHKKEKYTLTYPINYGFVPKVIGGDGEELDVYLLGVAEPVKEYTGVVIAARPAVKTTVRTNWSWRRTACALRQKRSKNRSISKKNTIRPPFCLQKKRKNNE